MDITKYSKKTWIAVLVLAAASILLDVLTLTGVIGAGDETMQSTSKISLIIGLLAIYYGVRGVLYHVKKDKEQK